MKNLQEFDMWEDIELMLANVALYIYYTPLDVSTYM